MSVKPTGQFEADPSNVGDKSDVTGSRDLFATHQVFNQSPVFGGHNAYLDDAILKHLGRELPPSVQSGLAEHGAWAGSPESFELARLANQYTPVLKTFDSKGNRIDQVEFHSAWHELMRKSISLGMHCSSWGNSSDEKSCRNLVRAVRYYMTTGVESGHLCPITMTNACVAAVKKSPEIAERWWPLINSRQYDPSNRPVQEKQQAILGMGMTEKQGGTDVRAGTTQATSIGSGWFKITGHKWFMSAPQADAFLVLAQMPVKHKAGVELGCFLVSRFQDDGSDNGLRFQRLKDKLGNRSNASSEVEFHESLGQLVGEEGKGVQTIIEMVTLTRLDCAVASAGLMRAALWEAIEHCRHRNVMGSRLIDQPLMRNVLADMSLEVTAATAVSLRLATAFDRSQDDPTEALYARLLTPAIKYWNCKIAPGLVYEAMECLGGNGYVEDGSLARHYREAPLNAIWEGSGNVMCLDVLRAIGKQPSNLNLVLDKLQCDLETIGVFHSKDVQRWIHSIGQASADASSNLVTARFLTERFALMAAAAELARQGLAPHAEAFSRTRLDGPWRSTYGMLDRSFVDSILKSH